MKGHTLDRIEQLRTAIVAGDAMEPELYARDTVYYLPTGAFRDDDLYVFKLDGVVRVKYIQGFVGGVLKIIPRNERYKDEVLVPVAGEAGLYRSEQSSFKGHLEVLGVVVCRFPNT